MKTTPDLVVAGDRTREQARADQRAAERQFLTGAVGYREMTPAPTSHADELGVKQVR